MILFHMPLFKPVDGFVGEVVFKSEEKADLLLSASILQEFRFFSRNFIICLKTPSRMSAAMK